MVGILVVGEPLCVPFEEDTEEMVVVRSQEGTCHYYCDRVPFSSSRVLDRRPFDRL